MTLEEALRNAGSAPALLVAVDFDGTLAPIVDDPDAATGDPRAMAMLEELAISPGVTVAVLSGRTHDDLLRLVGLGPPVLLVGEHGNDLGDEAALEGGVLESIAERFEAAAEALPGAFVERKRRTIGFHHRRADHEEGEQVATRLAGWAAGLPDVKVTVGKKIVEAGVGAVDKGDAIALLRAGLPAGPVVFFGDDTTDEHAFRALEGSDVGVKVGGGETAATFRVSDTDGVVGALEVLGGAVGDR